MALTINHQTNDISATSGSVTIDGSAVGGGGVTIVRGATSTFTGNPVLFTVTHGQGSTPDFVWGEVIITSAQHGYSVGDSIKITNVFELDETDYALSTWGSSTQMGLACSSSDTYKLVAKRDVGGTQGLLSGQSIRVCGVWYD